jgi:anti-sigma-K factor RskA
MSESSGDADLLAGEYCLGCLSADEMRAVEARADADPGFARMIAAWESRLSPLAVLAAPLPPPPALWPRLEASITPREPILLAAWRSARLWRITTAGALALAASLAGIIVLRTPPPPHYLAALMAPGAAAPAFVARSQPDGRLLLTSIAPAPVPTGRDLELWALAPGSTRPVSLGVIPPGGKQIEPPSDHTQLLVSLEPAGGSPTGQASGPVLYAGTVTRVD